MYEFLRRLSEPTPTVPLPRFKHIRRDTRPWQKRVASGFHHVARLLAGFVVAGMAMAGLSWWSSAPVNSRAPLALLNDWWSLPIAATIMLLTAQRWAPFAIAFFFGPGLRNALIVAIGGPNPASPIIWLRTPRLEATELATCLALVVVLTWRFLRERPAPTTLIDRCALTLFAITSLEQAMVDYRFPPVSLLSGITALFVAWVAYRLRRTKQHRPTHQFANS
jgi:hypothetical protein